MMNKPYLRLVQYAFPYALKLFAHETSESSNSAQHLKRLLQSSLGLFIDKSLEYFLQFKVQFDELLPTIDSSKARNQMDEEMKEDDVEDFGFLQKQSS